MEFVTFDCARDSVLNDIRRHSLIPIIGSGFSRGCRTKRGGTVPSGEDYKKHMLDQIKKCKQFKDDELSEIQQYSFPNISEIYNADEIVNPDNRRNYLIDNFCDVILDDKDKIKLLNQNWDYIYTLNIDDAIERNSSFSQVVYANRCIYDDILSKAPSVIKLHGDVDDLVKYKDSKCEVFDSKQYAVSPATNSNLLKILKHDFEYQNIIFIGCSLSEEPDLAYTSYYDAISTTNRYFCHVNSISRIEAIQLKKYGITHCVRFDSYDSIYKNLVQLFEESQKIQTDEIDNFIKYKYRTIDSGFELNSEYLFQGKSPIENNETVSFPNFFISRIIAQKLVQGTEQYALQILFGQGCSGKTYIAIEFSSLIRNRNVYYFESKSSLSYLALESLFRKNNSIVIFDEHALSNSQIELLLKSLHEIRNNNTSILLISKKSDRDLPGLIKYAINQGTIQEEEINKIFIDNCFSHNEVKTLNSLLVKSSLGIFSDGKSIVDNIIFCANELAVGNRYSRIMPEYTNIRHIVCLILLAIKRKAYSKDIVLFDLEKEMTEQCKIAAPLIEVDYTKQYEISVGNNSPVKYVLNAEYWLCDFLSAFVNEHKQDVIDAFQYIIRHIIIYYGRPDISFSDRESPYKDYVLFDNISYIFKKQANLFVIKDIYEALNDELSTDPNYLHQRAKCYIRLSEVTKEYDEKLNYLKKAFYDSNTAHSVFEKRYIDTNNDKVFISASHALYTKALSVCHLCHYNNYKDKRQNTVALKLLVEALQSPYNTYRKPKDDRYNYGDVVMKLLSTLMTKTGIIEDEGKRNISILFNLINRE